MSYLIARLIAYGVAALIFIDWCDNLENEVKKHTKHHKDKH